MKTARNVATDILGSLRSRIGANNLATSCSGAGCRVYMTDVPAKRVIIDADKAFDAHGILTLAWADRGVRPRRAHLAPAHPSAITASSQRARSGRTQRPLVRAAATRVGALGAALPWSWSSGSEATPPLRASFNTGIGAGSRHAIMRLLSAGDPRRQRNRAPPGAPRELDMTSDREIRVHWRRALALAAMLCAGSPMYGQEPIPVGDMSTPESALHDPEADVYLVSNINGGPGDRDDNGFISRVSPDGQVLDLKWIDGADPGVTLHAPKGSAVYGDRFYVADIDVVRRFDRTSGAPLGAWAVPNAGFLNDVAVGADGTVYVTDTGIAITAQGFAPTGTAAIYRFDADGEARAIAQGDALALPNGIIDTPQGLVMVPVGGNTVVGVAPDGELTVVAELPQGQLDGVVALEDGSLVVSSFGANAIYHVSSSGAVTEIISDTPAADIGFDVGRSRVLIPQLDSNRLLIYPVDLD